MKTAAVLVKAAALTVRLPVVSVTLPSTVVILTSFVVAATTVIVSIPVTLAPNTAPVPLSSAVIFKTSDDPVPPLSSSLASI